MPNLNTAPYLQERVETVWGQTYANWELVVSDNYSEDGAWELLQRLARQAHAIWLSWPRSFGTGVTGPTLSAVCLCLKDRDAPGH